MSIALIFIATGLALLGVVVRFLSTIRFQSNDEADLNAAVSLLAADKVLWTKKMGERIFSETDLEFVSNEAPLFRQRLLRERRNVALSWIAQRKAAAAAIMRYHRLAARTNVDLRPGVEIKLAANYIVLLASCKLAQYVIWLRGPFASRVVVSGIMAMADRMESLSQTFLRSLDSRLLD